MKQKTDLFRFMRCENGAVTVDYVVFLGAAVIMALTIVGQVGSGVISTANSISAALAGDGEFDPFLIARTGTDGGSSNGGSSSGGSGGGNSGGSNSGGNGGGNSGGNGGGNSGGGSSGSSSSGSGNPGNDKDVGNSGETPNGKGGWGSGSKGRSD